MIVLFYDFMIYLFLVQLDSPLPFSSFHAGSCCYSFCGGGGGKLISLYFCLFLSSGCLNTAIDPIAFLLAGCLS